VIILKCNCGFEEQKTDDYVSINDKFLEIKGYFIAEVESGYSSEKYVLRMFMCPKCGTLKGVKENEL
jgi:acetone carboxylase gamma subunit